VVLSPDLLKTSYAVIAEKPKAVILLGVGLLRSTLVTARSVVT
jgi:hypothetical protein